MANTAIKRLQEADITIDNLPNTLEADSRSIQTIATYAADRDEWRQMMARYNNTKQWITYHMYKTGTRWTDWLTHDEMFTEFFEEKRNLENYTHALEYYVHD